MINILIILSFYIEACLLFILEKKMWGTIYTPLNILMLPYSILLLFSIGLVNTFNLFPFNYETILIWQIGLALFFIPSIVFRSLLPNTNNCKEQIISEYKEQFNLKYFMIFSIPIIIIYGKYIIGMATNVSMAEKIGSDDFADKTSAYGLWAHIFNIILAIEVLCFQYISKKRWWLMFPIVCCILFAVIAQIKGWILIPIFAGVLVNIFCGKFNLNIKVVAYIILVGTGFFFLSYYLSLVFSKNEEMSLDIIEFIFKNFSHYLSSGILGLSMDYKLGILEPQSVEYLFAPFVNTYKTIKGEPLISAISPYYLETTWDGLGTNIRTFIGTIYVYGGPFYGSITILLFSSVGYFFRIFRLISNTQHLIAAEAWYCAILAMGWFDYYYGLLNPYEVLVFLTILPFTLKNIKTSKNAIITPKQI